MATPRQNPPGGETRRRASGPGSKSTESPHYRRAQRDRGAETRAQLIEAGLDVFGRLGFEGASTREIAKAANANLAAIVYHFGGKEALHIAVAEHIVASIRAKIGPTLAEVGGPAATESPQAARAALDLLLGNVIEVILGSAEAERWALFIVREQLQPTAAFDIIYGFMNGAVTTATRLIATILGQPESEALKIRVITLLGQVLVFRVAQTLALRRMGWAEIGEAERQAIRTVIQQNLDAILEGVAS